MDCTCGHPCHGLGACGRDDCAQCRCARCKAEAAPVELRLRAQAIADVAKREDPAHTKSFAFDMLLNAVNQERKRCAELLEAGADAFQRGYESAGGAGMACAAALRTAAKEIRKDL